MMAKGISQYGHLSLAVKSTGSAIAIVSEVIIIIWAANVKFTSLHMRHQKNPKKQKTHYNCSLQYSLFFGILVDNELHR